MESMSELMERRLDVVDREQSRLSLCRGSQVTDIDDDRTHVLSVFILILLPEGIHPSSTPFRGTGEIIGHEYSEKAAVSVRHLESLDRGIVHRHILKRLDIDPINLVGGGEDPMADILHLEIWLGLALVKSILASPYLVGIVEPVPRLDPGTLRKLTCGDVLIHNLLHVSDFLFSLSVSGFLDLIQKLVNGRRVSGHLLVKGISGKGVESKHPGLLRPKLQDL